MAANTCTSGTGTVTGTDPSFTLTQSVRNTREGVFLFLKYTIGTSGSITLTFTTKCVTSALTATDAYSIVQLSGSAVSALTYTISAAGNYKIPVPLSQFDDTLLVAITFGSAATDGAVAANILES
jgi:hypothetical protein